ncbi:MAG: OmpP1/FadL family transporter [Xanthobacteraceae bacterium]
MHNVTSRIAILRTGAALAALTISSSAFAGGFAIREQSTEGQGASFAGVAAGGAPSSMFWNPATMTQSPGKTMEQGVSFILPRASQGGTSPQLAPAGFTSGIDNSAESALVPNGYNIWQWNQNLWLGVSTNSTFGLSVGFPNPKWAGAAYGQSTSLKTYNATPSVAYKVNDWISIGAGIQIQYAAVNFTGFNGLLGASPNLAIIGGSGWAVGWTAGVTLTPWAGTQIGVGYRSSLNQDIDGNFTATNGLSTPGPVSTTLRLPDMISVGVRQRINAQFTALGTFEWTNWSRIGTAIISQSNGSPALGSSGAAVTVPFQYTDGYFYSGGLEYIITQAWTARAGFGYEKSPITDAVRTPRLPDNDRYWYSFGLTNTITPRLSVDLAYSFIDVVNTPINITAASGNPSFNGVVSYVGNVSSHINILSVSVRYRSDTPPAPVVATKG